MEKKLYKKRLYRRKNYIEKKLDNKRLYRKKITLYKRETIQEKNYTKIGRTTLYKEKTI